MQTFQEFNEGILDLLTKKGREKRGVEKAEQVKKAAEAAKKAAAAKAKKAKKKISKAFSTKKKKH